MSAIRRGFRILNVVTAAGASGMTFSRIVEHTGVSKATTHRLLSELVDLSALTLDPETRCYRGGLALAQLGAAVIADYDLRSAARPYLQALHDEVGHVATLGVRDSDSGVYIDKIESKDLGFRLHSEVGKTFPLHGTAMGKVLLSHAEAPVVRRILARKLEAFTRNTVTDAKELREELSNVKAAGYAVDNEEITRGLVCLAAPIFAVDGEIAGAMSCTVPSYECDEHHIVAMADSVCRLAMKASRGEKL